MTVAKYLFIGEKPSPTATRNGWTWLSGRLCAKTLHEALTACGIDPLRQLYGNWYEWTDAERCLKREQCRMYKLTAVALGNNVSRAMMIFDFPHLKLVHPAARGKIRLKTTYEQHVREVLCTDN